MRLRLVFTFCFFFMVMNISSQVNIKMPNTIYNPLSEVSFSNSFRQINVNIEPFEYRFINQFDIINHLFVIDFANFGKKASNLDYDSYRNLEIYKYHDKGVDLYRQHAFLYEEYKRQERNLKRQANKIKPPVGVL